MGRSTAYDSARDGLHTACDVTDFVPLRILVGSRQLTGLVLAVAGALALILVTGERRTEVPFMRDQTGQLQIWMVLACGVAMLAVGLMDSELTELEQSASVALPRMEIAIVAVASALSLSALALTVWLRLGLDAAPVSLRIGIAWLGLALISQRILGTKRYWVLPICLLATALLTNSADPPPWVQILVADGSSEASWLYAAFLLTAGVVASCLTAWRLHAVRPPSRAHG